MSWLATYKDTTLLFVTHEKLTEMLESKDYTQIRNTIMVLTKVCSHRCDK